MDNKIQLNEEQSQEARIMTPNQRIQAQVNLVKLLRDKKLPTIEEQRAYMSKAAQDMVTNKEPKKEKLTISDSEMSMYLGVSPGVKEQFFRQMTSEMNVGEQMKLITKIAKELKLGKYQNSEYETDKLSDSTVIDEKQIVKEEVSNKTAKRLSFQASAIVLNAAEGVLEDGYASFPDYSAKMFDALGEFVLPYLKAFYELARVSFGVDGMTDAVEVAKFDIDNFLLETSNSKSNTDFTKLAAVQQSVPMKLINHPWAKIALWKLAENLPSLLLDMAKDEPPVKLLKGIEKKVEYAMDWQETAIENGACLDEAEEIAITLLDPSYCPEEPEEIEITQSQMNQIYKKLVELSNENL